MIEYRIISTKFVLNAALLVMEMQGLAEGLEMPGHTSNPKSKRLKLKSK